MTSDTKKCSTKKRYNTSDELAYIKSGKIEFKGAGKIVRTFKITVMPQNDICPYGKVYPRNDTNKDNNKIPKPEE